MDTEDVLTFSYFVLIATVNFGKTLILGECTD